MLDKLKEFYKEYGEQGELLPIIFVMGIVPLIVKQKNYMTNLNVFSWYSNESYAVDMFNYYKMTFLIVAAVIMALLLLVDFLDGSARIKKPARIIFIVLATYELLAVLSCCFSKYRWFSVHGTIGHFETVFVLMAYGILLLYTYCSVKRERDVRAVLLLWGVLLVPMILIGFTQIAGHDFYGTDLGNRLIMTAESYKAGASTRETFEKGRVYLSLYNPNYVGAYGAMLTPLMVTLCLYSKSWKSRVFYGFLSAGLLICLMGASAKTGLAALALSLFCLGVLLRRQIIHRKKVFLVVAALAGVLCVCFVLVRGDTLVREVTKAIKGFRRNTTIYNLEGIETRQDGVEVKYKGNMFLIQSVVDSDQNMGFMLTDAQGDSVELVANEENTFYTIKDERFSNIRITPASYEGTLVFDLNIEGKSRYFSNQTQYQGYYYLSPYGKFTKINTAPHWGFEGYEGFATHRGYTWARTLPLLKDYFFIGSGPDTFLMVFPQDDYIIKAREGFEDKLMSKPHNLFLQIGVQTGVLSLAAYLTLYAVYVVWSMKVYWKNNMEGWMSAVGASIFTGTVAYMIVGVTTDSSINVAPVFWCLLGIGMAANQIVSAESELKPKKEK